MMGYVRKFRTYLRKNDLAKGLFVVGVVLLVAVAVWGGIRFELNTEYPILVVSSPSMCPATNCVLPVGALIVIKGQDPSTIQVGQIIVFRPFDSRPNYLVVHRVFQVYSADQTDCRQIAFQTKGDANYGPDGWPDCRTATVSGLVSGAQVLGVYQNTIPIPYLGSAILFIRDFLYNENTSQLKPQGIIIIVALIVALFTFEVWEPTRSRTAHKQAKSTSDVQISNGSIGPILILAPH